MSTKNPGLEQVSCKFSITRNEIVSFFLDFVFFFSRLLTLITLVLQSHLEVTRPICFFPAVMNGIFTATKISYTYLMKTKKWRKNVVRSHKQRPLIHFVLKDRISSEWPLSPHNTVVILRNNGTCLRPLSKCYVNNDSETSFVLEKALIRLI